MGTGIWYANLPLASWSKYQPIAIEGSDGWFKVYRVPGNAYAIYDDSHWEQNICYLVPGEQRAALIDTSMGFSSIKAITDALTDLPVTVLLTHTHHDHMGCMHEFDEVWCFDSDYAIERCTTGKDEFDVAYECADECFRDKKPKGIDLASYVIAGVKPAATMHDGQVIDLGGRQLRVVATPGHTEDSVCFVDEANGILFTGDTYYPSNIFAFSEGSDVAAYAASMHRLAETIDPLGLSHVYPGHMELIEGSDVIAQLADALDSILAGRTDYRVGEDGYRYYPFDRFGDIITKNQDE